jgi:hypothetical protein
MSSPATGAPDFQTYTSWHGIALLDQQFVIPINTSQTLGSFDSSSYQAVHLSVATSGNGGQLTVLSTETVSNLSDDIAGQWVCRPDTRLNVTVPLPRTKLVISAQAEPTLAWTFSIRAALTNVGGDKHHYYGRGGQLTVANVAAPNASFTRYFPTTLVPGPAHIWVNNVTPANPLAVSAVLRNLDGTQGNIFFQDVVNIGQYHKDFIIPTDLWELSVFNQGPGATTYSIGVITQGMMT